MKMDVTDIVAPAADQSDDGAARTHVRSFLVVDDDQAQRMVLSKVGSKAGYAVTAVATVEDAIKEIEQQQFHCIALDLFLKGQNGMLMLGEIAKLNSDALLIVMSGASSAVREETLKLATHFHLDVIDLPKPVDLAALRTLLQTHLDIAQPSCL
jgi:DNA-binding NtrC family response regulator